MTRHRLDEKLNRFWIPCWQKAPTDKTKAVEVSTLVISMAKKSFRSKLQMMMSETNEIQTMELKGVNTSYANEVDILPRKRKVVLLTSKRFITDIP